MTSIQTVVSNVAVVVGLSVGTAVGALAGCAGGGDESVTIYLKQRLGPNGPPGQVAPVLAPVERERRAHMSALRQAVLDLRVGPSPDERARGFLDTFPPETRLVRVHAEDGTAIVELAGKPLRDVYADAAVVYTVTEVPGIRRVSLRFEGNPCCVFDHDGRAIDPVTRRTYRHWAGEPCHVRTSRTHVRCRSE